MCVRHVRSTLPGNTVPQDIILLYLKRGEIVPLIEYIVGRNSDRCHASNPSCYSFKIAL
jgi:hypothetical protein